MQLKEMNSTGGGLSINMSLISTKLKSVSHSMSASLVPHLELHLLSAIEDPTPHELSDRCLGPLPQMLYLVHPVLDLELDIFILLGAASEGLKK